MTTRIPRPYTFTVVGDGLFPFDMLRYDSCYPKTQKDSGAIEKTTRRGIRGIAGRVAEPSRVTLVGPREPATGRWSSFGWEVVAVSR